MIRIALPDGELRPLEAVLRDTDDSKLRAGRHNSLLAAALAASWVWGPGRILRAVARCGP